MYCRSCAKECPEQAIACTGCGVAPLNGNKFCNSCGEATAENAIMCVKCGCSLSKRNQGKAANVSNSPYDGFYCSSDDKIIFGLCGGLAHKFGMQTSQVRVLTFISAWFFIGWIYLAGIVLPKHPTKNL